MSLFLQNSTKDAIITYTNDFLTVPIIIQASGENDIITFDNSSEVIDTTVKKTADGAIIATVKPVLITGKMMLQWLSPARLAIANIQNTKQAKTLAIPGTLNIVSPSGAWNVNLPTVVFTGIPSGPTLNLDGVGECQVSFSCDLPTNTILGSVLSTAASVANLLG